MITATRVKANNQKKSILYIIGNELAERYSYYGMQTILYLFLTLYMTPRLTAGEGRAWAHLFFAVVYIMPLLGALLSDIYWGKYKTILRLSAGYVLGHFILALWPTPAGFLVGCALIAIGAGGIKPNISTMLGDQLPDAEALKLERYYSYFYLAINTGAFVSFLSAEYLLRNAGHAWAFGLPGVIMGASLVIFYLGRKKYIIVPPIGLHAYKGKLFGEEGKKMILRLVPVYAFIAVFWALFDQNATTLVDIAKGLNNIVSIGKMQFAVLPTQWRAVNTVFILVFVPLFTAYLYPALRRIMILSYFQKIVIGMVLAALSFVVIGIAQYKIDQGMAPGNWYLVLCYGLLTAAEVFISVTALEFGYALAPKEMKAFVMSFYSLSIALGNLITSAINLFIHLGGWKISDANYVWLFTIMMVVTTIGFTLIGKKLLPE